MNKMKLSAYLSQQTELKKNKTLLFTSEQSTVFSGLDTDKSHQPSRAPSSGSQLQTQAKNF